MKENRMKTSAARIDAVLETVRHDAIDDAEDVIWAQVRAYEKLLDSKEAWGIYMKSTGDRFIQLMEIRRKLTNKKNLLETIDAKINELKWQEQ